MDGGGGVEQYHRMSHGGGRGPKCSPKSVMYYLNGPKQQETLRLTMTVYV